MKKNLDSRRLVAFLLGLSLAVAIGFIAPLHSFSSKATRASVLVAQDEDNADTFIDDSSIDDSSSDLTPEEELQYLDDAQTQLTTFKRDAKGFKTSLTKCNRKRSGTSKDDCYIAVYEKMQLSLQATCAYSDVYPDAIGENCGVLGDYIDSYDEIDVGTDIAPLLKDFMKVFGTRFFSAAQREMDAQRADLEEQIGGATDGESTVDLGSQTAQTSQGGADNQCFDHNYKSYLSGYCIDLRKSSVVK